MIKLLKKMCKSLLLLCILAVIALIMMRRLFPLEYFEYASFAAEKYGVDVFLIEATMKVESDFNQGAVSHKDAKGLMQITDETAKWCAGKMGISEYNLFDAEDNINIGTFYFRFLLDKYDGDISLAAAAYNAGHGNVDMWMSDMTDYSKTKKLNIPYMETERYVRKVVLYNRIYSFLYGTYN